MQTLRSVVGAKEGHCCSLGHLVVFWFFQQALYSFASLPATTSIDSGGVAYWAHAGGFPEGGGQPTGEIAQAIEQTFGRGWVWLVSNGNDDRDYLRYQNQRGESLENWWNVVNWPKINRRYQAASA